MAKYTLVGVDSNAFSIMGYVVAAMKKENQAKEEINAYKESAMAGDYDSLLGLSIEIIDCLNDESEDYEDD